MLKAIILIGAFMKQFQGDGDKSLSKAENLLCRQSLIDKKLEIRDSYCASFS